MLVSVPPNWKRALVVVPFYSLLDVLWRLGFIVSTNLFVEVLSLIIWSGIFGANFHVMVIRIAS